MTGSEPGLAVFAVAAIFAAVHLLSPRLVFLDRTPRSIWLSFGGGVSVAYVFVHLLPELAALQSEHDERSEILLYLWALAGLVIFYGLEQMAKGAAKGRSTESPWLPYAVHLGAFAVYNFLIGYLLEEQALTEGWRGVALYTLAMGLHFVVNDRALYAHHHDRYLHSGRWILIAAIFAGTASAFAFQIGPIWLAGAFAFLGGSVVLNVIKEELPEERESRFWAFALGAVFYTALVLAHAAVEPEPNEPERTHATD